MIGIEEAFKRSMFNLIAVCIAGGFLLALFLGGLAYGIYWLVNHIQIV